MANCVLGLEETSGSDYLEQRSIHWMRTRPTAFFPRPKQQAANSLFGLNDDVLYVIRQFLLYDYDEEDDPRDSAEDRATCQALALTCKHAYDMFNSDRLYRAKQAIIEQIQSLPTFPPWFEWDEETSGPYPYDPVIEEKRRLSQLLEHIDLCSYRAKQTFLPRLERDLGKEYYYCQICVQLHRWSADWKPEYLAKVRPAHMCPRQAAREDKDRPIFGGKFWLEFDIVRLVMNRHLRGPEHGLDVGILELKDAPFRWDLDKPGCCDWDLGGVWRQDRGRGGWVLEQQGQKRKKPTARVSIKPRIIDDELYLRVTRKIEILGSQRTNRRLLKRYSPASVCHHPGFYKCLSKPGYHRCNSEPIVSETSESSQWLERSPTDQYFDGPYLCQKYWCNLCQTDAVTTVKREALDHRRDWKNEKLSVTLTSCHRLGAARDSRSAEWWPFVANGRFWGYFGSPRFDIFDSVRPGSIFKKWNEAAPEEAWTVGLSCRCSEGRNCEQCDWEPVHAWDRRFEGPITKEAYEEMDGDFFLEHGMDRKSLYTRLALPNDYAARQRTNSGKVEQKVQRKGWWIG